MVTTTKAKPKRIGNYAGFKPVEITEGVKGSLLSVIQSGHVEPDTQDVMIANRRIKLFDADKKPRVGDYVVMPTGKFERFAYAWRDGIQTTPSGSFYLGEGYGSMSGGLNSAIPNEKIKLTNHKKPGFFWIFHHDHHTAHNGVAVKVMCRVYKVV